MQLKILTLYWSWSLGLPPEYRSCLDNNETFIIFQLLIAISTMPIFTQNQFTPETTVSVNIKMFLTPILICNSVDAFIVIDLGSLLYS